MHIYINIDVYVDRETEREIAIHLKFAPLDSVEFGVHVFMDLGPFRGVLCWVVSKSRTRRKRTPLEEPPPKIINFGGGSSGVVLLKNQDIWIFPPKLD